MTEERKSGIGDGIRTGIGILTAVKEAIEETLQEAIDRGDLSQERAKATVRDTMSRVQSTFDDARDRLDVVPRREFEDLRGQVSELRARLERMEASRLATDAQAPSEGIPVD